MQSILKGWHWDNWGQKPKDHSIYINIYIYIYMHHSSNLTTKKLDWPLDGTADVCRARLSFSSINSIPFFVASATRQFRSRGLSGDMSRLWTHSGIDVLRADGTHPAARLFKGVTPIGTSASWFRMVLSFSTKWCFRFPPNHSYTPGLPARFH